MAATTEARHARAEGLDGLPPAEILSVLLDGQLDAVESVRKALPDIERAAKLVAEKARGRRPALIYCGAGSSGLMAMADGLEMPGTYGITSEERAPILLAGGEESLRLLAGGYEDDVELATSDVEGLDVRRCQGLRDLRRHIRHDALYGARRRAARARGAVIIGIANNAGTPLLEAADIAIFLASPPEVIAGSTRMGAEHGAEDHAQHDIHADGRASRPCP